MSKLDTVLNRGLIGAAVACCLYSARELYEQGISTGFSDLTTAVESIPTMIGLAVGVSVILAYVTTKPKTEEPVSEYTSQSL